MVIVVMGVAGVGKSTIGSALASRLGAAFIEGDARHPERNISKMSAGEALDDDDRGPWLGRVRSEVERGLASDGPVVVACSALRRRYRDVLRRAGEPVVFVHLEAPVEVVRKRLERRRGVHFMPVSLLESQIAALEAPDEREGAIRVDAARSARAIVGEIVGRLRLEEGRGDAV